MLNAYCANVLKAELAKADYNGMTADQAWAWLTQPVAQAPVSTPTGALLTPVAVARLLGPAKAEAVAAALKSAFPTVADHLMSEGVDPLAPATETFFASLVASNVLTSGDVTTLTATGTLTVTPPPLPPRFHERFNTDAWPHVAEDGTVGTASDKAIHGFPNAILRADFDAAWAGRAS